jgi:hypothetical protein
MMAESLEPSDQAIPRSLWVKTIEVIAACLPALGSVSENAEGDDEEPMRQRHDRLAGAVTEALAPTFVIAGTKPRPTRRMPRTAKDAHVRALLRQQRPGRNEIDAGNGAQPGQHLEIRLGRNRLLQPGDLAFHKIQILHQLAQHEAVMLPDAAAQNQTQLGPLAAKPALGLIRQPVRLLLAGDDGLDDRAATRP